MTAMTGAVLSFDRVGFAYGNALVLDGLTLALPAGTVTALMGPSGCGKSTALALAAGLLAPGAGSVRRHCRRAAIVFQEPRLLPWRTALANVAFALKAGGGTAAARRTRAGEALAAVGLSEADFGKFPARLSGGMRMRTALARALVVAPDLLLLDEPFSALDPDLARRMYGLVRRSVDEDGVAALIVTHDPLEAAQIADRAVRLSGAPGRVLDARVLPGTAGQRSKGEIAEAVAALLVPAGS